jgi:hypothetical protein
VTGARLRSCGRAERDGRGRRRLAWAAVLANIYGVLICVIGFLGIAYILWMIRDGDAERHAEDAAREFFERHGHWPDQTPEEAEEERRRLRAAASAPQAVSRADADGLV